VWYQLVGGSSPSGGTNGTPVVRLVFLLRLTSKTRGGVLYPKVTPSVDLGFESLRGHSKCGGLSTATRSMGVKRVIDRLQILLRCSFGANLFCQV